MNKILQTIFIFLISSLTSYSLADIIKNIDISGNYRIEKSTILDYLKLNISDEFTSEKADIAIRSLYATSFFENIELDMKGDTLKVHVKESPFIGKVTFKGNSKVSYDQLKDQLETVQGTNLKNSELYLDKQKIVSIYKTIGIFHAKVEHKLVKKDNNVVEVIFNIEEGPQSTIKKIYFIGNKHYPESLLKRIISTKEFKWYNIFTGYVLYDPYGVELDKQSLRKLYHSVGFFDFKVTSFNLDLLENQKEFVATYSLEEGARYKFGKITLKNELSYFDDNEILDFIEQQEGGFFNRQHIDSITKKITDYLSEKGYTQIKVLPNFLPDKLNNIIDVSITVNDSNKIFIDKINITGNIKTEDKVLRNILDFSEGDILSNKKINSAKSKINNIAYFSDFMLQTYPTDKPDRYDLDIDVIEQSTAQAILSAAYSTQSSMFVNLQFKDRNFVGTAKHVTGGLIIGHQAKNYYFGLTDPNFLDRGVSFGVDIFYRNMLKGSKFINVSRPSASSEGSQYNSDELGANFEWGYNILNNLLYAARYKIKKNKLDSPDEKASMVIREQVGTYLTSSIEHDITYNMTDNYLFPKNGYSLKGVQEFAGLGGNIKYVKHKFSYKFFKSFLDNKYTFSVLTDLASIEGLSMDTRIVDRFSLGDYHFRGFAPSGIGPRDISTKDTLGGKKYYKITTELAFPLGLPKHLQITGALFLDAGSLWGLDFNSSISKDSVYNDNELRASVGFSLVMKSHFLPLRFDWGFPIKKQDYDKTQCFHVQMSFNA